MEKEKISGYFKVAQQAHDEVRRGVSVFPWDEREQLFHGRYKHPDEPTKSILSTGELTTLSIDGACRVMAQLPSGRFINLNGNNGANMVMNLYFEHYVLPNAIQGGTMLRKLRVIDLYSRVFGTMPVFIDWVLSENYTGPDLLLVHPRRFRPQAGKVSIGEMEYTFIDVEVSREWLESKKELEAWKDLDKVLEKHSKEEGGGTPEIDRSPEERGKTKTGITLRHIVMSNGDWMIQDVATDTVLVEEKDWFGCFPVSAKHQYPRLDNFWSYSDFERGELTQKSLDSISRFYLDTVQDSINPPRIIDPEKVILPSLKTKDWYVKNGEYNAIQIQNASPKGLETYQSTYQILKANLMSLGADTDTSVSSSVDVGFGKTPEALKQQGERKGARDAWDSYMMKEFIEDAFTKMANMIQHKGIDTISFRLLGSSIQKIIEQYPQEDFSILGPDWENGNFEIPVEAIKGQYRYVMDEGSNLMKKDDTGSKLMELTKMYFQFPEIQQDLAMRGQRFDVGEAFKRMVIDQGIQDSEKIIITNENPESLQGVGSDGATVDPMEGQEGYDIDPTQQVMQ